MQGTNYNATYGRIKCIIRRIRGTKDGSSFDGLSKDVDDQNVEFQIVSVSVYR